jgi:methylenetetrahydrofolate dehydrogenase (NADP+)/methenyltetrahydrofolate cyclohydrolase
MQKLLAKPVAESIQIQIRKRTELFIQKYKRTPTLVVVLVGNDPASVIYTTKKNETARNLGFESKTITLPVTTSPQDVKTIIDQLNLDANVDGILIQRPLPRGFQESEVLYWVTPEKDVDAFHPINAGKLFLDLPSFQPCTPAGVMALLEYYKISPAGKIACVIGRSSIVGKPMAALLLRADATVLHCHSKTPDLRGITQQAELLIVAAGKMGLIDRSYIRPGAVVIDVGMHRNDQGKLAGDVLYDDVLPVVSAITPVPGGVGPMTITLLLQNTILAAERREA